LDISEQTDKWDNTFMKKPTLLELCKTVLYIGFIGYGGPAILAQMKKTLVHDREWIVEREFMDALSLAQILPGATGVSVLGYVGYRLYKFWGGILLPLCFILPATTAILILSWGYFAYGNLSFIQPFFIGLGALVVALLVNATLKLGQSVFKTFDWQELKGLTIALATFTGAFFLHINIIWLILTAGLIGIAFFYFTPESAGGPSKPGANKSMHADHPTLKLRALDFLPVVLVAAGATAILFIPEVNRVFLTFINIGLLAFGGGFTSIPIIQHQIVDNLHWLDIHQFMDGIALGQVTPGPVFITATFIGYKVLGVKGALAATFGVFTPSITLMIALSGLHGKVKNSKMVKAIVKGLLSGFIGLLVSVTLQFALKSLHSWQAWLIFIASLIIVLYYKRDILWAILGTVLFSIGFI
jgi:chromate transporter